MFRNNPVLAAQLLSDVLDVDVPSYESARIESTDLTDCTPTEYRADAVVVLKARNSDRPAMAIVIEVQRRPDERKRWSWPVYVTTLRARRECPTVLLVVCPTNRTAQWCAEPIPLGHPGMTMAPLVVSLESIPAVTDPEAAIRAPELAVLSARAHSEENGVVLALYAALMHLDRETGELYTDYALATLSEPARKQLEDMLATGTYEFQSDFYKRQAAQEAEAAAAKAAAKSVIKVLTTRGVTIPDGPLQRILRCTDTEELDRWLTRAVTANTIDDLFV